MRKFIADHDGQNIAICHDGHYVTTVKTDHADIEGYT